MLIRFTRGKRNDVLTCRRDDGTTTWMAERPGFVAHDLGHYAVETVFGYRLGFFGLVAQGWELSAADFGRDRGRRPLPLAGGCAGAGGVRRLARPAGPGGGHLHGGRAAGGAAPLLGPVPDGFTEERIARARRNLARLEGLWAAVRRRGRARAGVPPGAGAPGAVLAGIAGIVGDAAAPAPAGRKRG